MVTIGFRPNILHPAKKDTLFYVLFCGIFAVGIFIAVRNFLDVAAKKRQNFEWFKQTYPDNVKGTPITCRSCGGENIGTERLMNKTFVRRHFCRTCGTDQYYTPE